MIQTPEPATRDPDDDYLIALARAARADLIVSVDRDLLDADLEDARGQAGGSSPAARCLILTSEVAVEERDGLILRARHQVAVAVEGDRDRGGIHEGLRAFGLTPAAIIKLA